MTTLHGLDQARAARGTRAAAQEPVDAAGARESYAAWQAIFERAQPAHPEPARPRVAEQSANRESGSTPPAKRAFDDSRTVPGASVHAGDDAVSAGRSAGSDGAARAQSAPARRVHAPVAQRADVEVATMSPPCAISTVCEAASEVGVRIHYLPPLGAQAASPPESEVVSIILEGADVSIIVRASGLTETQALRTAFATARELTGRSAALRQLTVNGRVLYQQATAMVGVPSGDLIFAC